MEIDHYYCRIIVLQTPENCSLLLISLMNGCKHLSSSVGSGEWIQNTKRAYERQKHLFIFFPHVPLGQAWAN